MNRRIALFVALAVVLAVVFVRLGFWQLSRLQQRRARNAQVSARLAQTAVPFEQLRDTLSFRLTRVSGTPDSVNEIVYAGRSRNGSPGVYVLTPIRRAGSDTAVLVIRGWVYAPDAATADLSRWRESRTTFSGYVANMNPAHGTSDAKRRLVRSMSAPAIRALLPYPVADRYVVSRDTATASTPARLDVPALDDGPHLSYAIQWFSFATIALVGAGVIVFRARVSPQADN